MDYLNKEDYIEPRCPLCSPNEVQRIPLMRVVDKLDEYLNKNDYQNGLRHLNYWLAEAEASGDMDGMLGVSNELIGLHRKLGNATESLAYSVKAIKIAKSLGMEDSVTMATTLLNAATANNAFGLPNEAVELYTKARELYEKYLNPNDTRLAGLYNNTALALVAIKKYGEAEGLFNKAMSVLEKTSGNEPEMAVTYCNMADLKSAQMGLEESASIVNDYLTKAQELLEKEGVAHNGNYAYVCEKCASTFGYYGYFMYQEELEERAKKIYAGA